MHTFDILAVFRRVTENEGPQKKPLEGYAYNIGQKYASFHNHPIALLTRNHPPGLKEGNCSAGLALDTGWVPMCLIHSRRLFQAKNLGDSRLIHVACKSGVCSDEDHIYKMTKSAHANWNTCVVLPHAAIIFAPSASQSQPDICIVIVDRFSAETITSPAHKYFSVRSLPLSFSHSLVGLMRRKRMEVLVTLLAEEVPAQHTNASTFVLSHTHTTLFFSLCMFLSLCISLAGLICRKMKEQQSIYESVLVKRMQGTIASRT